MEEKVIGFLKTIGEMYFGTVVSEDDTTIYMKDVVFVTIGGQDKQISVNFVPIEMLSVSPPFNFRNFLASPADAKEYPFKKDTLFLYNLELNKNAENAYLQFIGKKVIIEPDKTIVTPDNNKIQLF